MARGAAAGTRTVTGPGASAWQPSGFQCDVTARCARRRSRNPHPATFEGRAGVPAPDPEVRNMGYEDTKADVKESMRHVDNKAKETWRKADGNESVSDKIANAGDDVRDTLGDAGDE